MSSGEEEQSRASKKLAGIMKNPEMAFSSISDTFSVFVDLGLTYLYNDLIIENDTNEDIVIEFKTNVNELSGTSEITVPAKSVLSFDSFRYWDEVRIKYKSIAPTQGVVTAWMW